MSPECNTHAPWPPHWGCSQDPCTRTAHTQSPMWLGSWVQVCTLLLCHSSGGGKQSPWQQQRVTAVTFKARTLLPSDSFHNTFFVHMPVSRWGNRLEQQKAQRPSPQVAFPGDQDFLAGGWARHLLCLQCPTCLLLSSPASLQCPVLSMAKLPGLGP